jgi:hypothetical protein
MKHPHSIFFNHIPTSLKESHSETIRLGTLSLFIPFTTYRTSLSSNGRSKQMASCSSMESNAWPSSLCRQLNCSKKRSVIEMHNVLPDHKLIRSNKTSPKVKPPPSPLKPTKVQEGTHNNTIETSEN